MKKLDFLPNLKNKYSIRKFTVGTASILIGSLLFLGHNDDAQAAEDTNENAVAEVSNDTTETQSSAQENEKVTPETTPQIKTENVENTLENNKTVTEQQNVSTENKDAAEVPVQSDVVKEQSTESESVQKNNEKTQDNKISVEPKKEVEAEKSTESSNSTENTVEKVIDKASVVKKDEVDNSVEREVEATSNKTFNTSTEVTKPEATKPTVTESEKAPKLVGEKSVSSENLSTEQKVEKVKAELSSQRDSAEIDQALSVIDTEGLTSEEIKAEVVKLLFKRGLAEKDLYTTQATPPRKDEESPKYAVRAGFKVNTDLKDEVVVTKDNFNDYFWTVDNASYDPNTGIATLTPNEPSKKGAITLDTKLNVNKDFHFSGEVNLGDKYEGHPKDGAYGGDGISFTFNPGNTHDLGLYGSAIGVGGLPYAFGFKLDTYVNNSPKATEKAGPDPRAFNNKGAFGAFVWADASGRVTTQDGTGNWKAALLNVQPEDNKFQPFTIDYSGDTKDMTITYAGQTWTQNMNNYFNYTKKYVYALGIAASTGGAYNLQQVKINKFTYTASALLAEYFVDQDTGQPIDKPLRTSGDIDSFVKVVDHSTYLQQKGYKLINKDTSLAPDYDAAKNNVKLTNATQFIVYNVKDIEAPKIADVTSATNEVNTPITPIVLNITDNSGSLASKKVTGLPAGLTFDETTNTISGTPTSVGLETVTVTATDHAGLSTTKTFTFTVTDTHAPTINDVDNKTSEAYTSIAPITLSAEDNSKTAPTLAVTGLPAGLTFDPTTKQITGKPTTPGTSTVTITATDASNNSSTKTFEYIVQPNQALEALKAVVADAKAVTKDDYTPNSVSAMDNKVSEGEALLAHPENGSTDQFNAKAQEVTQSKNQLVHKADKTELEKAIAEADKIKNINPGNPIDQQLQNALTEAKNIDKDLNATQKATDDSKNKLNTAIQEKLRADAYEKLQAVVGKGAGLLSAASYTPETVEVLKDLTAKYNDLIMSSMSDDSAIRQKYSVKDIEDATKALDDGIKQLKLQADKTELNKAITKANNLNTLEASDKEDKAVLDKLAVANQVKADGNATKEQVDNATAELNKAIDQKLYQDALDRLNQAINDAKTVNKDEYTPDSVTPFTNALNAGEAKATDKAATPDQLDAATKAITDAKNDLKHAADKTDLKAAIAKAEALTNLVPTDKEDKAVQDALNAGKNVDANANATPQEVADAAKAINDAVAAKEYQDALDELNQAIKDGESVTKENYTPETVTPLETTLTDGKTKAADKNATPDQLKAATQAIKTAKDSLKQKADKAGLNESVNTAEDLKPFTAGDAEDDAVQTALNEAKDVQANQNADQAAVDAAKTKLDNAVNAKKAQDAADAIKKAALDELQKELDKVAKINKNNFTPDTVIPLTNKEDAGKAIVAAPENKSADEIKVATQALKDAENALQVKSDKAALEAAIDKANGLGNLVAADAEDKAVQDKLAAAIAVKNNDNASQPEVKAATQALNDAIAAKEHQDALDELKAELAKVAALDKATYTPNSLNPVNNKETEGKDIVANPNAKSTDEIKAATEALKQAENGLAKKADKTALQTAIDKADAVGALNPADTEDKAVQDKLAEANAVKNNDNATPDQVQAATEALNNAVAKKEKQDALDELNKALKDAEAVNKADFTPNSVAPFTNAVEAGKNKAADNNASPAELKAAAKAITDAKAQLQQAADKQPLEEAINKGKALGTLDESDKEDKAVKDALTNGEAVKNNANATAKEVADATNALNNAIAAKEKQDALDELQKALDDAAQVNKDQYKPKTVTPFENAIQAGQTAKTDAAKTPAELKAAAKAINDAKKGLETKSDKAELNKSIKAAEALTLNPAAPEDKAVQDALTKAKEVEANQDADQPTVDQAKIDLDNAVKAKNAKDAQDAAKAKQDALDALKAELAKVAALDKNLYTPQTVNPLNAKEAAGQAIVDAPDNKSIDQINAATDALKAAEKALVTQADKAELQKAIDKAKTLGVLDLSDAEDNYVHDKLEIATAANEDKDADQEYVNEVTDDLKQAIEQKLYQDALDELNNAIKEAEKLPKDNYTPDSIAPFDSAITDGKAKAADTSATPEQLKAAAQAIKDANDALKQKANKDELNNSITAAEAIQPLKAGDSEDDAVKAALDKAKAVQGNDNADQNAIDAAKTELDNAVNAKKAQDAKDAAVKQAALDELKAELAKVAKIDKDNFTPDSVTPLTEKENAGQAVIDAPQDKTVDEIKAATKALQAAEAGLQAKSDKAALQAAIDKADAINDLNPTDAEDKEVQDKLAEAKTVKDNPNASQQEVQNATQALNDAVADKEHADALDALKAELAKVEQLNKDGYTPNSVAPLSEKEIEGKDIVASPGTKSTDEIKKATEALKAAEAGLVDKANKEELQKAIDKADALNNLDAADPEDKAVQDKLAEANTVKDDGNATPEQVQAATKALNDAVAAKEHQDALDELQKALDDAAQVNKDQYKPDSVTPFEAAVNAGTTAKNDAAKTPEELKEAAKAIKDAQAALQAKANKAALDNSIQTAEGLGELDPADAEDKAVKDALDKAKAVKDNQNADQAEVDAAKTELDNAIKAKQNQDAKDKADAAKAKEDALNELKAELEKAAKLDKNSYTPNSVAPLTERETEGKDIVAAPDAKTTNEIKEATQALKDAENALQPKADKTELEAALDKAVVFDNLDDNDTEDKALHDALLAGQEVEGDLNATPEQVKKAADALNNALDAKAKQDALDELNKAIDAAKAVNKDDYKPNTVTPLEDAVKAGEAAKADAAKTPEELKEAAKAIKDAQAALQAKADKADLDKAVTAAEALQPLKDGDAEDDAVKAALEKAKEVQADPNADQKAVDAAKDALNKAVQAKADQDKADVIKASLDALKAELDKAKAVNKDNFTPNSVKPLEDAAKDGQAIVDAPTGKTAEEINKATQAVKDALAGLQAKADKAELEKSITKAEALNNLDTKDAEDKAVQDALTKAKAVQADPNADQKAVNEAKDALNKAINAKNEQDAKDAVAKAKQNALDALKAELEKAKAVNKDNYTPRSVKPLAEAIRDGEAIVNSPAGKTAEEIKAATDALKEALKGLQAKADKEALDKAVKTADDLNNLDPADAEDAAVLEALTKAKDVQGDANASQAEVDNAKADLDKAVQAKAEHDKADVIKVTLDALKAELEKAKAVSKDKFTPNSVKPLEDAAKDGQAIVDAPTGKTAKEITAATDVLKDALKGLQAKADKSGLEKTIKAAEKLNLNNKVSEDKTVSDALAKAYKGKANPNATQDEVNNAQKALEEAINHKVSHDAKVKADELAKALAELQKAIDNAKLIKTSEYTHQTIQVLQKAVENGKSIIDNSDGKSLKDIASATKAINDAINNLKVKEPTVIPTDKKDAESKVTSNNESSASDSTAKSNVKQKQQTNDKTKNNKAKVLPDTGQDLTSVDPKYASLMFVIDGLMMYFRRRKNEDKDSTEK